MKEEWRDIPGYEGKYLVSNLGRVYSISNNTIMFERKKTRWGKDYYSFVRLCKNGKIKEFTIHRLVAEVFVENPFNLAYVNHKDENKRNNRADNLEWVSFKYNLNYGTRNQRIGKAHSKTVFCYKDDILVKTYSSLVEVEKDGYNKNIVWSICKGNRKNKEYMGFVWKYA